MIPSITGNSATQDNAFMTVYQDQQMSYQDRLMSYQDRQKLKKNCLMVNLRGCQVAEKLAK